MIHDGVNTPPPTFASAWVVCVVYSTSKMVLSTNTQLINYHHDLSREGS
jgi:hypothetical protein